MTINVRLLVHAGASSTRLDDHHRVLQAAEYLDVEASRTHIIWPPELVSSESLEDRSSQQISTVDGPDSTTFIDDTQLAYTSLESQLIPCSARTVHPTPARRQLPGLPTNPTEPTPSKSVRLSESPVLRPRYHEREQPVGDFHDLNYPLPSIEQERRLSKPKPTEKTQSTEGTTISNDTTSELPASYSLGEIREDIEKRPQLSERSLSDPGPSPAKRGKSHEGSSQPHSQQILLREPRQPVKTASDDPPVHESVVHEAVPAANEAKGVAAKVLLLEASSLPQDLSTSIQPDGPETSVGPFTTYVTHTLNKLAQNPELTATFLPTISQRSLDKHERGHWEVQCSNWTPELQVSFWRTLETVVGTGKAGWGVWCTRGAEVPLCSQSSQQRSEPAEQVTETFFGPVRVYCWGEIVKHIYLLLFVASNSKVRKLGLRWIDAQGLAVIQMRMA